MFINIARNLVGYPLRCNNSRRRGKRHLIGFYGSYGFVTLLFCKLELRGGFSKIKRHRIGEIVSGGLTHSRFDSLLLAGCFFDSIPIPKSVLAIDRIVSCVAVVTCFLG